MSTKQQSLTIPALKVRQWLPEWNKFRYKVDEQQEKPEPGFMLCSVKASTLKALTGVYRRSTKGGKARALDQNIQRGHEQERSEKIRDFIKYGYPWCDMGPAKRKQQGAEDDKKPGWIPTAILVNILAPDSKRNGQKIADADLIKVEEDKNGAVVLKLPAKFSGVGWKPNGAFPLEVIDGQHRLWAFEGFDPGDDFELPVVAYYGLDHGWQAYLFWSVNITPKKINRSLAFDLYPLLRQQTWLDRNEGHSIYRETRCQELVEALWSNPESPWHQRINMLGEKKEFREYKGQSVTQAAFIRSLLASFVKQWNDGSERIGGLFGASAKKHETFLRWNRAMQAAFLVYAGRELRTAVSAYKKDWAADLRRIDGEKLIELEDAAFYGEYSLLTTDQGIRGFLFAVNDLCYVSAKDLELDEWEWSEVYDDPKAEKLAATEEGAVAAALKTFAKTKAASFIEELASGLAKYDWRSSSTPGLTQDEQLKRLVFRGSSGYREIRRQLLSHLRGQKGAVGQAATTAMRLLSLQ